MAYYIGSNIKIIDKESISFIVFTIMLGMVTHYLLNFVYELSLFGWHRTITKSTRYDIWLQGPCVSTATATNSVILLSTIFYLSIKEQNKIIKTISIAMFFPVLFYTVILRRRTQLVILVFVFIMSLIINKRITKNFNKKVKHLLYGILVFSLVLVVFYLFNFIGFKDYVLNNSIIAFIRKDGMSSGRLDILFSGIKYIPKYLWGGQLISQINGNRFHDLLLDIYDYAGIVSFAFMAIYLFLCIKNTLRIIKSNEIDSNYKLYILEIYIGYFLMFIIEPIMTGSSIFMICGVLIEASIERLLKNDK